MKEQRLYPAQPPISTGIRGRCPRCGQGKLFAGYTKLAKSCDSCGLDYKFADPADGPAFFAQIMTFPVVGLMVLADAMYSPPLWVHLVVSVPALFLAAYLPLRPLKGWLVCSQYFHKAEQGRLAPQDTLRPSTAPPI